MQTNFRTKRINIEPLEINNENIKKNKSGKISLFRGRKIQMRKSIGCKSLRDIFDAKKFLHESAMKELRIFQAKKAQIDFKKFKKQRPLPVFQFFVNRISLALARLDAWKDIKSSLLQKDFKLHWHLILYGTPFLKAVGYSFMLETRFEPIRMDYFLGRKIVLLRGVETEIKKLTSEIESLTTHMRLCGYPHIGFFLEKMSAIGINLSKYRSSKMPEELLCDQIADHLSAAEEFLEEDCRLGELQDCIETAKQHAK